MTDGLNRRSLLRGVLATCATRLYSAQTPSSGMEVGGAKLDLVFEHGKFAAGDAVLVAWVKESARAVSAYYGRFPVQRARIQINFNPGRRVTNGTSYGEGGAHCRITVGQNASETDLRNDWELPHEMVHFSFPSVPEQHHWIEEGIATYVEPVARASVGDVTVEKVWTDWIRDMPQGLPESGDEGLDNTHTWGRTYWGGAVFCLLADINIRKHTNNAKGLRDALRAINRAGGNIEADWPLERALALGDKATDGKTLSDLYKQLAQKPGQTDLPALWEQLGVKKTGNGIAFDDRAPLAAIRKAIVSAP